MPDLHVPEKAVEALTRHQWSSGKFPLAYAWEEAEPQIQGSRWRAARADLQAALPAIYEQRDREWRERLLSEEAVARAIDALIDASCSRERRNAYGEGPGTSIQAKETIQAAIAVAFPGEGE